MRRNFPDAYTTRATGRTSEYVKLFRALRRCRAEYIADCAGDDFWVDERKLQKQADLLDANPEVGLVHTDWRYYSNISGSITTSDPDGSKKPFRKPLAKPGELDVAVQTLGILIHFCSALFRKASSLPKPRPIRGLSKARNLL